MLKITVREITDVVAQEMMLRREKAMQASAAHDVLGMAEKEEQNARPATSILLSRLTLIHIDTL